MSEYWVSHKKYFCKYCNIYIADDAPSRTQHEGGLRHKGNVERFVRGLYKAGEKRKQDMEEEKREMARVEQAAQAAFARDVGSGLVKPGSSSTPAPPKPIPSAKPAKQSSNPYDNYSSAASLGYADPDLERMKAEAERRQTQGIAGEWQVVSTDEPPPKAEPQEGGSQPVSGGEGSRKREAEATVDDDDGRHYKLRKKKFELGLGELYDPGLSIKLKVKKQDDAEVKESQSSTSTASEMPKWSTRGWAKPSERPAGSSTLAKDSPTSLPQTSDQSSLGAPTIIGESNPAPETKSLTVPAEPPVDVKPKIEDLVKAEEGVPAPSSGGMFRRRKIPAGGRGRR